MKKFFAIALITAFAACNPSNNNPGESGAINDGINTVDTDGALQDTTGNMTTPQTDTAKGEHRTDKQERE